MSAASWVQLGLLVALLLATAPPLGRYLASVYTSTRHLRIERAVYRVCRVDPDSEQRWTTYAFALFAFSVVSFVVVYVVLRLQTPHLAPHLAFDTAVSFMTNTNWQSYGGETTMSHYTQMSTLAVQNFVSAAAGMAVLAAFIRGLARKRASTVGNFWVDLVRTTIRVLVPLSFVFAIVFVSQGVVQNFNVHTAVHTVEGATQLVPGGPAASQVAIKQLGSNGGGFFNANSAHPFENSTPLTGFVEMYLILLVPFALAFTFGRMVGDKRQGRAVFAVMFAIWLALCIPAMALEANGNPRLTAIGAVGGNMEGKEVRFGPETSALWAVSTTGTSNGSVDSMHDSYTPLGGAIAMWQMKLGEVSPGGVGVGLNGLLVMVILAVFVAGLMVGRTPEYLGKKIQAAEMKLVVLYALAMPAVVLGFAAASVVLKSALTSLANPGPHGLSEILYAFTSAGNNNGSAFAGLTTATPWYDTTLGIAMLVGRFFLVIPVLALAGSLGRKQPAPASAGTFPTHTPLFIGLVVGVTVILAGLVFFPALALGPIVEHLS